MSGRNLEAAYAPSAAVEVYRKDRLLASGVVESYYDDTGDFHGSADQFLRVRLDDSFDRRVMLGTYAFRRTASGGFGRWLGRAKTWIGIGEVKVVPASRPEPESGGGKGENAG